MLHTFATDLPNSVCATKRHCLTNLNSSFIYYNISTTDETGADGEEGGVPEAEAAGHGKDSSLK